MIPESTLYGDGILGAGKIAEHHPAEYTMTKNAEGEVPFGRAVVKGTDDEDATLPSSGSDTMIGISAWSTDASGLDDEKYEDGDPLAVVETGIPVVQTEEAVSEGDPVRIRHSEDSRSGYQDWGFATSKASGDASGLANDATKYGCIVVVDDDVVKEVSIVGSAAQTIGTVISQINADLGADALAALVNGKIRITSPSSGAQSKIAISDGNDSTNAGLFATLTGANAEGEVPVDGSDDVDPSLEPGKFRTTAVAGKTALVSGASWKSGTSGAGLAKLYVRGPFTLTADV